MKKVFVPILIFILIFNFIFCSSSYSSTGEFVYDTADFDQANNDGKTKGPGDQDYSVNQGATTSTIGAIVGILAAVIDVIPMMFNKLLIFISHEAGYINFNTTMDNVDKDKDFKWFTIEKVVFGNYYLLNADVFNDSEDLEVTKKDGTEVADSDLVGTLNDLREQVANWYNIMRIISLIIGVITLIYMGIRMAISTVAEEQAKYKKMLVAWVQSIIIIAILPYIMIIINYIGKLLLNLIDSFRTSLKASNQMSFETEILDTIYGTLGEKRRNDSCSLFNSVLGFDLC